MKHLIWLTIQVAAVLDRLQIGLRIIIYRMQKAAVRSGQVGREIDRISQNVDDLLAGPKARRAALATEDRDRYGDLIEIYFMLKETSAIYEAFGEALPLQIYNEMRNALDHFSRSLVPPVLLDRDANRESIPEHRKYQIQRSTGHVQRALFDVIKLCCSFFDKEYARRHKLVPRKALALVNGGDYIREATRLQVAARQAYIEARQKDAHIGKEGANTEVIRAYCQALIAHMQLNKYQTENFSKIRSCGYLCYLLSGGQYLIVFVLGVAASLFGKVLYRWVSSN